MTQTLQASAGWALSGADTLHAIRRPSAACAAQQLSSAASSGGGAVLRQQRPKQGSQPQSYSAAAVSAAAAPPTATLASPAVAAMPVRPDQPGLATVRLSTLPKQTQSGSLVHPEPEATLTVTPGNASEQESWRGASGSSIPCSPARLRDCLSTPLQQL